MRHANQHCQGFGTRLHACYRTPLPHWQWCAACEETRQVYLRQMVLHAQQREANRQRKRRGRPPLKLVPEATHV